MHILHLAPDTDSTPEDFAALVLTPELILLELLSLRRPHPLPPAILTSAIAGLGLTKILDDDLKTSKLVMKLQRLYFVLNHLDDFSFQLNCTQYS